MGTNSIATSIMLKAGANEGATGENAIVYSASNVDIILGSIEIICANSLLGELTPLMARSVAESSAKKILPPLNRLNITFAGVEKKALPHYIDDAIELFPLHKGIFLSLAQRQDLAGKYRIIS